jgi:hypothetical protein
MRSAATPGIATTTTSWRGLDGSKAEELAMQPPGLGNQLDGLRPHAVLGVGSVVHGSPVDVGEVVDHKPAARPSGQSGRRLR